MTRALRWTLPLMAAVTILAVAGAAFRGGAEPEEKPVRKAPALRAAHRGIETREEVAAPVEPAAAPAERRKPRDEGYREAREATWEGALSGQVVSPEGPLAGFTVRVEWLLARQPDREEAARLKRGGARRDRDGTWWASATASTDESGCFTVEGLPAVPLRVHAGSTVQQAQVGTFARLATERPQ